MAERHVVEEGTWQSLENEGELFTSGIQTCVGISIYSPNEARAILGHFPTFDFRSSERSFSEMNLHAYRWLSYLESSRIWVGGAQMWNRGSLGPDIYANDDTIEIANKHTGDFKDIVMGAVTMLIRVGATLSEDCYWLKDTPATLSYSIDVATGEEKVSTTQE